MIKHLFFAVLALSLVAGCNRAGRYSNGGGMLAEGPTTLPSQGFYKAWETDMQLAKAPTAMYLTDDLVFVYTKDNEVAAFTRSSLNPQLRVHPIEAGQVIFPPLATKDRVIIPTNSTLECFTRRGDKIQSMLVDFAVRSAPVSSGTMAYMGGDRANGGRIVCLSIERSPYPVGTKWEVMSSTGGSFTAAPALYQGFIYAGARDGCVYSVKADDGAANWTTWRTTDYGFKTDGEIRAALKADATGVYVASRDQKLYCLDPNTGRLRWTMVLGEDLGEANSPVLITDMILIPTATKGIVALDKAGEGPIRSPKWTVPDAVQVLAADNTLIYLLGKDGAILAVEKEKGKVKFTSVRRDLVLFATNLKDNTIYAISDTGRLVAIKPIAKPGMVGEVALLTERK